MCFDIFFRMGRQRLSTIDLLQPYWVFSDISYSWKGLSLVVPSKEKHGIWSRIDTV